MSLTFELSLYVLVAYLMLLNIPQQNEDQIRMPSLMPTC